MPKYYNCSGVKENIEPFVTVVYYLLLNSDIYVLASVLGSPYPHIIMPGRGVRWR